MRLSYLIIGMLISFIGTIQLVEPYQAQRDITTTRLQALQSCYFTAVKFAKMDEEESAKFCEEHSETAATNYKDIAQQMDKITDDKYSPVNYWSIIFGK